MPKKTVKIDHADSDDDSGGGPMPDWKRKKNLEALQKQKESKLSYVNIKFPKIRF